MSYDLFLLSPDCDPGKLGPTGSEPPLPESVVGELKRALTAAGFNDDGLLESAEILVQCQLGERALELAVPASGRAPRTIEWATEWVAQLAERLQLKAWDPQSTDIVKDLSTFDNLLRAPDAHSRKEGVEAVGQMASHDRQTANLLAGVLLQDESFEVRKAAASELRLEPTMARFVLSDLVCALRDEHPFVRAEAAYALGEAGVVRADILAALSRLERDAEYGPKARATQALSLLQAKL